MNLYILNESFDAVGIVDNAASIIWNSRYYESGDFEIYITANSETVNLYQKDYYIYRVDDETICIIENIKLTSDNETGDYLTVSGHCAKSLLARRIVWQQTTINRTAENAIRKLITDAIITPTIESRKIENFTLSPVLGLTERLERQFTGTNLYEAVVEICKTFNYGWKVTFNLQSKQFIFSIYQGSDRSSNQSVNPRVKFSPEFDNLLGSSYTLDSSSYKNVALIAGEGEGKSRKTQMVGEASGLNRYELFIDARDISSNEGEITETEYNKLLQEKGINQLAETVISESFSGEVDTTRTYQYKKDYFLGDIVTIENEYGMAADTRIVEVIESLDENGYRSIPTFENWE